MLILCSVLLPMSAIEAFWVEAAGNDTTFMIHDGRYRSALDKT
jgi:hypothetical protein